MTKYQIFMILPQISHFHKFRNFSSIFATFETKCFIPINFMAGTCQNTHFHFCQLPPVKSILSIIEWTHKIVNIPIFRWIFLQVCVTDQLITHQLCVFLYMYDLDWHDCIDMIVNFDFNRHKDLMRACMVK